MSPLATWPWPARLGLAAILGAIGALGLEPVGAWPATVLALAATPFLLGAVRTAAQAAWTGWAFGLGWFAVALNWIVDPFFVDAAEHAWMAPFAIVFMCGGLALFWGGAWALAQASARPLGLRVAALVCTWTLAEFARGWLFTGFPWAAPGQVWIGTNAMQVLAWVGPHGLDAATFLGAIPLGLIWLPASRRAARTLSLVPALALVALIVLRGAPPEDIAYTGKVVRLVQPNAPQDRKWNPDFIPIYFQRQLAFTGAAPHPDLVVWPEASLAGWGGGAEDPFRAIADAAAGAEVVVGMLRPAPDGFFNSLIYLDQTGAVSGIYDKHHLVPFGEYIPFPGVFKALGLSAIANAVAGDMLAGPGPQVLDLGPVGHAVPLICYEAVFAREVYRMPMRGSLLLQITNDAWFGTWSGPYQHLAQARMRAVEQGLPMARAANTGVSAMIDPYGRIVASLPLGQAGYVDARLPAPLAPTLYARTGDLPVMLVILAAFLGIWGYDISANRFRGH